MSILINVLGTAVLLLCVVFLGEFLTAFAEVVDEAKNSKDVYRRDKDED